MKTEDQTFQVSAGSGRGPGNAGGFGVAGTRLAQRQFNQLARRSNR